ncbi:2,3-bisphosphoglycerate-dependent phosphoglycerate mutase-like [Hippocampus zosterae]|uniref:2,3-bisphosphoglycerate-dependent phosphoglycerate mutase-like n=1 Tax=Hippocampus zosterae TaxID=109293 RepID=UPI00223E21DF|nr:2,3-bisphosphoglycerate-dependent phosphoglycerate mutase-like [Hippocampus zosterae]
MRRVGRTFCTQARFRVVFMRHGESTWNLQNRFTGWTDVKLTPKGIQEAKDAGQKLAQNGFKFDLIYTSVLSRAIQTYNYAAEEMDCHYLPVVKDWRLNERHYGALQGLNKKETAEKHGEEQVKIWRRSFDIPPPALEPSDARCPHQDIKYRGVDPAKLPLTESLKLTIDRVLPLWEQELTQSIKAGKNLLVVAHGNSLRAIVKHLDGISDADIVELNIPTAIPLVYEFDEQLRPLKHYYLEDPEVLKEKMDSVKNQGKK